MPPEYLPNNQNDQNNPQTPLLDRQTPVSNLPVAANPQIEPGNKTNLFRSKKIILLLVVPLVLIIGAMVFGSTKPKSSSVSGSHTKEIPGLVTTQCYSYQAPLSKSNTTSCDSESMLKGDGYYTTAKVLEYGENSGGSFEDSVQYSATELAKRYNAEPVEYKQLKGQKAAFMKFAPKAQSNVTYLDTSNGKSSNVGAGGLFVMIDVSNRGYKDSGGRPIVGLSLNGSYETDSTTKELNTILDTWTWK